MSDKIIQLNEGVIKQELKELVRNSVEETLNNLLDQEAAELTKAERYERTEERQGYRSGHYERNLTTTSGNVKLKMPKLKGIAFETAIIERYRRRESSVEEALIEMYLAGVSVRRVEDITEALWGNKNSRISYVVDVTVDRNPPVLEEVEQEDEDSIRLIFNKQLDEYTAEDIDNYTILDKNGKTVKDTIYKAVLSGNGKEVVIVFYEEIYGSYSIVVRDVEDLVGNVISKTTMAFTMKDTTPPGDFEAKIYKPGEKGQVLHVYFNDTMATSGRYSVLDLEKYEIVIGNGWDDSINLADINGVTNYSHSRNHSCRQGRSCSREGCACKQHNNQGDTL